MSETSVIPGEYWLDPISGRRVKVKSIKGSDMGTAVSYIPEGSDFVLTVPYHAFIRSFQVVRWGVV